MENVYRFEDAKTFVVLTYLFFAIKQKNPDHDLEIHILTCLLKATLGDEMDLRLRFASVGCTTPWCVCVCVLSPCFSAGPLGSFSLVGGFQERTEEPAKVWSLFSFGFSSPPPFPAIITQSLPLSVITRHSGSNLNPH